MTTPAQTIITCRLQACRCGCHGADPRHRRSYRRTVRQVETLEAPEEARVTAYRHSVTIIARGVAKLPCGVRGVVFAVHRLDDVVVRRLGWFVEHEDSNLPTQPVGCPAR